MEITYLSAINAYYIFICINLNSGRVTTISFTDTRCFLIISLTVLLVPSCISHRYLSSLNCILHPSPTCKILVFKLGTIRLSPSKRISINTYKRPSLTVREIIYIYSFTLQIFYNSFITKL